MGNSIKIKIKRGMDVLVTLPTAAAQVSIASPDIAKAVIRTPRELQLIGIKAGITSLIVWDRQKIKTFFTIHVKEPFSFARLWPAAKEIIELIAKIFKPT